MSQRVMTTMSKVFRVQDAEGRGPWRPGFSTTWIEADAPVGRLTETLMDLVPPNTLRSLPRDRSYGCGCRSYASLMAWFTASEIRTLAALGYKVVELNIDGVLAESDSQVVFERFRPLTEGVTIRRWP